MESPLLSKDLSMSSPGRFALVAKKKKFGQKSKDLDKQNLTLCMDIPILSNDLYMLSPGRLTSKAAQKKFYEQPQDLNKEKLTSLLFNSDYYNEVLKKERDCSFLKRIDAPQTILAFKIFVARQKDTSMFMDLIVRFPEKGCKFKGCIFNGSVEERIKLYAREWKSDEKGNLRHFKFLMKIIQHHHCRPYLDLVLAQGIDVNALGPNYETALFETCMRDDLAWATQKLIDHPECNVNASSRGHSCFARPLAFSNPDCHAKNVKILLTRADLRIVDLDADHNNLAYYIKRMTDCKVKNILLTTYPFLDEQK
jgi:hypothetical protein